MYEAAQVYVFNAQLHTCMQYFVGIICPYVQSILLATVYMTCPAIFLYKLLISLHTVIIIIFSPYTVIYIHKSVINFPSLPATPYIMPDTPLYIILVLYTFSCLGLYMWAASLAETQLPSWQQTCQVCIEMVFSKNKKYHSPSSLPSLYPFSLSLSFLCRRFC